jgi:hypothetical protein
MSSSILLLGEYNVGKSHFGGQLLGRLNQEQGHFRMVGSPTSLTAFEGVLSSLNDGRAAPHTSASHYFESKWPVCDLDGNSLELIWPDYGGEQISNIRANRSMPPEWRNRVQSSNSWIVMVRVNNSNVSDDIFSRPVEKLAVTSNPKTEPFQMSEQSKLVDFLQWLMFIRGTGTLRRVLDPQLVLLLSCWDELPEMEVEKKPAAVLENRMPMVSSFLRSNWDPESLHVLGLSALERSLSEEQEDEEYIEKGPEGFGYIVAADGAHSRDLTLVLRPLVKAV